MLEKYKEMLYNQNIKFDVVMDYMVNYVPNKLYKYRSFKSFFNSNLYEGLIYMASPKDFNDPFDSAPHMDIKEVWRRTGRHAFLRQHQIDINIEDEDSTLLQNYRNEIIKFTHEEMRVSCFAENCDSLLMWAHYADSHKGYCIEYDTKLMPVNKRRYLLPVIYQDKVYDS